MFENWKIKHKGVDGYCKIIEIKEKFSLTLHPKVLPQQITVRYHVDGKEYTHTQVIHDISLFDIKKLVVGNCIRLKYMEDHPEEAYINEFDEGRFRHFII